MPRRYLFGPITAESAERDLAGPRQRGECLAFGPAAGVDVPVAFSDTWEQVCARLPHGWRPDFVVLHLPYVMVPKGLWAAPVPLVGLAGDWNLLWHQYRYQLPLCDLVLTDPAGVEALARAGLHHAHPANLHGLDPAFLDGPWPEGPRDLDVLFVGNLHPAVQRERRRWVARLAGLRERWSVVIHSGVFGEGYRELLGRARIVFNHSPQRRCNRRAFEAAAAGALLFQEADNREVAQYFRDRAECVFYDKDNLETLLAYYLEHEEERRALADAARIRVRDFTYEALWVRHLELIEREWPAMLEHAQARRNDRQAAAVTADGPSVLDDAELLARTWQALNSGGGEDTHLRQDLQELVPAKPVQGLRLSVAQAAAAQHALGVATALGASGHAMPVAFAAAADHFQQALQRDTGHAVAGLHLTEALAALDQVPQAIDQARRTLAALDRARGGGPLVHDCGHFPPSWSLLRVEWQRAAWAHAGQPAEEAEAKCALLRWRLHLLLADLTGDVEHLREAVRIRPDLPGPRTPLGAVLLQQGRPREAIRYLREALADDPFDRTAARLLFDALGAAGDQEGRRQLARQRHLLALSAPQLVPEESWFNGVPAEAAELASVIILCCNQLEYTRQCLESLRAHTRPPYELILVDNGSTDGTPEYLQELRGWHGPARVVVLRSETNRGFAAGCNQGLTKARGQYVVLLNNDTVVTPGWLDGLIAWTRHEWPHVGLVGPVSNYAPPPQHVRPEYGNVQELNAFAARRGEEFAGKAIVTDRLTGFCLLLRRDVLEKIGGLDERFGLGFFEDDDLCLRARQAGFRPLVALNVFIHHHGSRTFAAQGIDCRQQLAQNLDLFRAKWGEEEAARYQPLVADAPALVVPSLPAGARPRVSLCMIVKNEEANLAACLQSVVDLVDEIIVVDTGSTDRTKEIAASFGARVFDFPWVDSFAAARNESLRHASGDYIFWLDADDRIDLENHGRLQALFAGLRDENAAFIMKCLCLPGPDSSSATVVDHVRLFRRHPAHRYSYRIHEQILGAIRQTGGDVRACDVVIQHVGYCDGALRRRKLERDLRLLSLENAEHPDDPFTLFNLGSVMNELDRPAEALPLLRRSLERSAPQDSIVRKLFALIAGSHRRLGQAHAALTACRDGLRCCPDDIELLFTLSSLFLELGEPAEARACANRLLQLPPASYLASLDPALRGHKARHLLAQALRDEGRAAEAEAAWRTAVEESPEFVPAWLGLGQLYLEQGRYAEVELAAHHLEATPQWQPEAQLLRARGHLARQEFATARQLLEGVIGQFPQAVYPRLLLSHVFLQEGKDLAAAQQALQDVLVLDPTNAAAQQNLRVLLRQINLSPDRASGAA